MEFPEKACMNSACKIGVSVAVLSAGQDVDGSKGNGTCGGMDVNPISVFRHMLVCVYTTVSTMYLLMNMTGQCI